MSCPIPYLHFKGTCEEAFNFYKKAFNGEVDFIGRFSEMPPDVPVPEGYKDKVMHISLRVKGEPFLLGSDAPDGYGDPFAVGNNVHLTLSPTDEKEARAWYDALRDGGKVNMELAPAFWAKLFAMVRDRHGVHWMISYGQPEQN